MRHAWRLLVAAASLAVATSGQQQADYPPQMQSRAVDTRATLEILEGRPKGTVVGTIPTKPGFTYRFNEAPRLFTMNASTGEIRTTAVLDREALPNDRFDLVVLSSQPTYPIEVRIIVLDTNDNSPEFPEPIIAVSFSESAAPGTRLLLDSASDRDVGVNGVTDDYRIVGGNEGDKFRLEVTANPSGEASYLHIQTIGNLDRETKSFYQLNISARDGGTPTRYGYLQVNITILDVNDNPPIFDHSDYNVSLNESVPPGTKVLQVMATDCDFGDNAKITYYLSDTERKFSVDSETGVIYTAEPLDCPQESCSRDDKPGASCPKSCVFTVYARDHGSPRQDGRTYVTVNLVDANDHDPVIKFSYFPDTVGVGVVDENAPNDTVVAAVSVVDLDEGPNGETTVEIKAGNELNHFRLEYSKSFDIVRVNGILDREHINKYNLTIVATDKGTPPRTATNFLIIHVNDVNDHEPVFEKSEYSAILSELAPPGTYVSGITATDEDTGVNARIYYAFISGNENQWFEMDTDSGLITTRALLDREVQGTVILKISARDGGPNPKWAYTQLKVTILDENDEKPTFSQEVINVTLSESTPPNTLVAMLTATDHDQGTNGSVTYSLHPEVKEKYPGTFSLDSVTGQLTVKTSLDRETVPVYEIRVIARDQGIPQQSSSATVFLTVEDVNDNNPEFYPQQYFVPISENTKVDTSLVKVTSRDIDDGDNASIRYSIESGSDGLFSIDSTTGVIYLRSSLAHSKKILHKLSISAKDGGGRRADEDATVEVIKANHVEHLGFSSNGYFSYNLLEDHGKKEPTIGREVGRVTAQLGAQSSQVVYSIVYGDPERNFKIDGKSGMITTANRIDREKSAFYSLTVQARAGYFYGKCSVNITVLDENDNPPEFIREKELVTLNENAAVGQEVYLAMARDVDSGPNSRITYELSSNLDGQFKIGREIGVVTLAKPIRGEPGTTLNIEIMASDSGSPRLSSRHAVVIHIKDVNDHTPVFDHTSYETSLLESTPVNDRFFALAASDADLGLNGQVAYTITEGNAEEKFGVFPDGYMYVKSALDREEKDYYSLTVMASDFGSPPRTSIVPVVIHVIDENDNRPQFTNATFMFYIRENEPPDSFVGKLTATDEDIGRNGELTFSISNAKTDFTVDPRNGFIKTLHMFDREELLEKSGQNFVTLEAIVSDNGLNSLTDKVKVNVYITDENDNAPEFLRTPYKVQISEGSIVGTQVIRVFTTDADEGLNGDVFYTLSEGNEQGKFAVDEATGQITVARNLDREVTAKYTLTVVAHDAGVTKRLSATTTVVIDVLDENDNAPEFTQTQSSISVYENATVNTKLIHFRATDADLGVNSDVLFSITAGNRKDAFRIDPSSGILYLHKPIDYEELNSYMLNITAFDGGTPKLSTSLQCMVNVLDCNDNPPSFPNTAIVRQIQETIATNTPIVTVTAEDPDSGINGKITYSISKQEPEDPQYPGKLHFQINPRTGVINTLLPIDREVVDTFRLTVVATDQAEPASERLSAEKTVTVIVEDANDNAPYFVSMNAAVLPADPRRGSPIMNVLAKDADSSTNGLVTYELISGNRDLFALHRTTGALTLKRDLRDPESRYHIAVKATDEAVQSERKSSDTYITLVAAAAGDGGLTLQHASGSVYENEAPGTPVVTVRANKDLPGNLEFYVTNVTGEDGTQTERLFDVDIKSGALSTAKSLDREAGHQVYVVTVYAILIGNRNPPHSASTQVQVKVLDRNDSPPRFGSSELEMTVSEEVGVGAVVGRVEAVDPDEGASVSYSLVASGQETRGENPGINVPFSLDQQGTLTLTSPLDREIKDTYRLRVRASDGLQAAHTTLLIKVKDSNDNAPMFEEYVYSVDVKEDTEPGTKVGQVKATDADQGANGMVTYSVISDWANHVFSINPQTGVFTLTSNLDYEQVQHYILVVEAEDSGRPSLSSTVTVYMNVLDINDNAPVFDPMSYSNEVYENVTVGTSIATVTATDMDSGDNGRVEYRIVSGDDENVFTIGRRNGTIRNRKSLDRETKASYNLMVEASDQAKHNRLSSTVQVSLVVKDVNDEWPEFVSGGECWVSEGASPGTVVVSIKAVDRDEGRNGAVEYSLSGGGGLFTVGPADGLLRVAGRLDRETTPSYTLQVAAKDRGDPPRTTNSTLVVTVLDENDNTPVFDPKQYSASVPENASIGATLLQVSATDIDEGLNGRIRYSIISGDENRDLSIGEDTGVIRVAKNLNFERKSRYSVIIMAQDSAIGGESRSDTAKLTLQVTDINDNPPAFIDSPYLAYTVEGLPGPVYLTTVTATDADTPPFNDQVRYFLKDAYPDIFRINSSTGEITLLKPLDREEQQEYILTLVAMDTGTPPLTGTGVLKVIVEDENDHSPQFDKSHLSATVIENMPRGTFVLQATAVDLDQGLNSKIRYNLVGDHEERFHVDPDTGLIMTAMSLDREEQSVYYLTLVARDSSPTDPKATAVNLTITVIDQNDNSPLFSSSSYTIHVPDKTMPGDFIFGAKATDLDEGVNSKIRYQLEGKDADKFVMNHVTGVIKTRLTLEDKSSSNNKVYSLKVIAVDSGEDEKSASADLLVKLMPAHLFPSISVSGNTRFSLSEDVAAGKVITKVSAQSPRPGTDSIVNFAIAGSNVGDAIRVDANTGEVSVTGRGLDYETSPVYEVWIEARDAGNPPLRSVIQLLINVTDANDNAPIMEFPQYNPKILEEEPPDLRVVTVQATDADSGENGKISYRLEDDAEGAFSIDPETGEIYTNYRLDRETSPTHMLIVEAIDNGSPQLTGTASVLVTILDKNDNPPKFTRLFSVNVTENAEPGSFVIRVTSSDPDIGENANATYSFAENPGHKFAIDPISGNVTVVGSLDRETQDEYLLKVAVVDGSWRQDTPLTITIQDQNDNAPEFEHSFYSFNFPELQRNFMFVGQVSASDRDKQGPNSVISYSLKHPSDLFSVDPASGEIFSKRPLRYKHSILDSSPENQYSLTILAIDNGKPPMYSECFVTINVVDANNNAPKFVQREYFSPFLSTAVMGQQITQVKANDELDFGINADIEYVIVNGNGSQYFSINKNTGWIYLSKKLEGDIIMQQFNLIVRAVDHGVPPQYDQIPVTLVVTGENKYNPVFTALSYQVNVHENEPVGTTIMTVAATDDDEGPNGIIRYSISEGNNLKHFIIDPVTGAVTILEELDYDTVNEYRLNITATDLAFEPRTARATLTVILTDINDNPPKFNQTTYEAYLPENSPAETKVYQVEAYDLDSPKFSVIQYSIVGGSGKDFFRIDMKTGCIYSKVKFDYEEKNSYTLDILAVNPDSPMYGSAKVNVFITGVNEYYPKFVQPVFHFDVSESSEIGTSIGAIQATDQDSGDDGKVYYLFVGSSNDKGFTIFPDSGIITISRRLDRETQNRAVLTVMAKNAGGIRGNDTDEAQVIVSIQDGNDPPDFLEGLYEADVSEGVPVGTLVLTVKAVDKDVRQQNNHFSYSLLNGNINKSFKIDPQTGDIETVRKLDRETTPYYTLVVGAIDTGSPPETGTTMVRIIVTDVNDNGPIFDPPDIVGYVTENEPPNTSIMTLGATDPDLPPNGAPFTYKLVGGPHSDLIKIDPSTGVVKTTRMIDRETTPKLEIIVEVGDSGYPKMQSQLPVSIVVLDQNDSPSTPRTVHVLVHTFNDMFPLGKIADVHPNDDDTSGEYQCTLIDNPSIRGILNIPTGCSLHTSRISVGTIYSFAVSGNDGKHPDATSTVTLEFLSFDNSTVENSITVRIENMTAPKFLNHYYKSFSDLLKRTFDNGDTPYLYSLHDNEGGLELTLAIKEKKAYKYRSKVIETLSNKRDIIKQLLQSSEVTIGYSPCNNSTCENNGVCSEGITVFEDTRITDSQSLILTSPLVNHEFSCKCIEGFMGKHCEKRQDPCSPSPCQAGGTCRRQGYDFHCICPPMREGKFCEMERGDICSMNVCKNGGTCRESPDGSSFFCLCRPGYRGNQCELIADSCRPNPCLNGGLCVSLKPGYRCNCPSSRHGRHCEKSTFGFNELSFMTFNSLDASTNDISMIFATTKPNALLIYNYGVQSGGRSDFVAIEIVNGKAVFSYGGARTAIKSITVTNGEKSLANGEWQKITATRNGRVISLSIAPCTDNGDNCQECRPGDSSCYTDDIGPAGTLNFNNHPMFLGGIGSTDSILERPGQVHSDDLVGCLHSVSINGRGLNLSNPLSSHAIDPLCSRSGKSPCSHSLHNSISDFGDDSQASVCGSGATCFDLWHSVSCTCPDSGTVSPDCDLSFEPVSLTEGSFIEYKIGEKHRRVQLLDALYSGSTILPWKQIDRSRRTTPKRPSVSASMSQPAKHISLMFKTYHKDGLIFFSATSKDYTAIELVGGKLVYVSKVGSGGSAINVTVSGLTLTDGIWHNLTVVSEYRTVWLMVDGNRVGEELDSAGVHDMIDPYLSYLSLGGVTNSLANSLHFYRQGFTGCLANFTINKELQPFNGSGSIFADTVQVGRVTIGCAEIGGIGTAVTTDPLSIGVSLVLVFFVILLVAILVSFLVFRLRRQKKEKGGGDKELAGVCNIGGGGPDGRPPLHPDTSIPPYMTDNGDVIRTVAGHHLVAPELISKNRYKGEEEVSRGQRPDIIEREVVKVKEHHPPLPHHAHDSGSDLPEHYDLDNSSSIAPSDIDIVYHYKGYREGSGNMRKYKTPPHLPAATAVYHKHSGGGGSGGSGGGGGTGSTPHRHSPHFPPRSVLPPPPVSRVDSPNKLASLQHQSTPLARLSPSSELSQQMPRILTLQDISGKPLQSALLAATSSSGGVGKDVLHSNSERSLNSPVMSQLSGQSSGGRKTPGVGVVGGAGPEGLRPRASSLVSTLDAVSSSSGPPPTGVQDSSHRRDGSTTTDESGNDSFTCSEIEYDNSSVNGGAQEKPTKSQPYDFDSSFRGSLSTLVASDDDLSHPPQYRSRRNGSPAVVGWDYLLNWGSNFETSLAGVFKDIAELPDSSDSRIASRMPNPSKPSEEYV